MCPTFHNCAQLHLLHHSHPSHPIDTSHSGHPSHLSHSCHPSNPIPHSHPSHPIDHFRYIKIHTWLGGMKQKKRLLLSLKMISFVLFPQASEPRVNFNIILPMGLFIPVILVILSSHPTCPSHPTDPIHLSHRSNPRHSSYPS